MENKLEFLHSTIFARVAGDCGIFVFLCTRLLRLEKLQLPPFSTDTHLFIFPCFCGRNWGGGGGVEKMFGSNRKIYMQWLYLWVFAKWNVAIGQGMLEMFGSPRHHHKHLQVPQCMLYMLPITRNGRANFQRCCGAIWPFGGTEKGLLPCTAVQTKV